MTTQVTVRFYRLSKEEGTKFESQLEKLYAKPKGTREINVADDNVVPFHVRLEDYDGASDAPIVTAQFVRRVLSNHPPEATDLDLKPLKLSSSKSGLGYPAALAYSPSLKIIAVEYSPRTLSLSRILLYMNMMEAGGGKLRALPVTNEQAWEQYRRGKPRKLSITLANPTDLASVEGDVQGVMSSTGRLRELFEAPMITIEVSMGHKKGFLDQESVERVLSFFSRKDGKRDADVRSLRASVKPDDGGATEDLDFLNELLTSREELDLVGDPTKDYPRRKAFVVAQLKKHTPYLTRVYGPKS